MNLKTSARERKWLIGIVGMTVLALMVWVLSRTGTDPLIYFRDKAIVIAVMILFAAIVGWFLDVFTGAATPDKVDEMVAFCYVFPFVCMAGVVLPLYAYPKALPDPPKPIGILLGCSKPPAEPKNSQSVPDGIRCGNDTDQWLVNIGGRAIDAKEYKRQVTANTPEGAAPPIGAGSAAGGSTAGADTRATAPAPVKPAPDVTAHDAPPTWVIEGGLVVPLYFVMLSLFGGFVSMLRRVPEYQERVSPGATNPITYGRAREQLVFEALQLLSAPLIAVTAYYLIDPASRASSIVLGFLAGFSSETILLYIRALAEKLQPETVRKQPDVQVAPATLTFGPQAVNGASLPQSVTLTNRSQNALTGNVSVTGDFAVAPAGPFTVAPGASATFNVTYTPTAPGPKTGQLTITDNAPGSPRTITLTGN